MNMGVPDAPISIPSDEDENEVEDGRRWARGRERRPEIVVTGDNIPINFKPQTGKRRRNSVAEDDDRGSPKRPRDTGLSIPAPSSNSAQSRHNTSYQPTSSVETAVTSASSVNMDTEGMTTPDQFVTPGLRHTNLRDVLQFLINDLLKVGGRPESAIAQETEGGEEIEVRVRKPNGQEKIKMVRWTVDPSVPETILIDEKDLAKMISCVFLNALKFTDEGSVELHAYLKVSSRYIVITVTDTGPGIPSAFLPNLFMAFAKEDDSLTRQSEGLGLGLMVARGLARKLGGDLACVRSSTSGPDRGTEFEIRIPVTPIDAMNRPVTPFGSPSPSAAPSSSVRPGSLEVNAARPRALSQPSDLPRQTITSARKASKTPPSPIPPAASTPACRPSPKNNGFDRALAEKHPLTFLVVEDNKINRKLLVTSLQKMGYKDIYESYDGADAVRKMEENRRCAMQSSNQTVASPKAPGSQDSQRNTRWASQQPPRRQRPVDVILMDLWMPFMDGYEASERILAMDFPNNAEHRRPTILAVTADVTTGALERAAKAGIKGFLAKPYLLRDLEKLILEYCATTVTTPANWIPPVAPATAATPASTVQNELLDRQNLRPFAF
jgi:CheY-like chemotaxis protein